MNTAGSLERKSKGTLVEMDMSKKKALADAQERIKAARVPKWSANLVQKWYKVIWSGTVQVIASMMHPDGQSCRAILLSFIYHGKHWSDSQNCPVLTRGLNIQRSSAHWIWALDNLSPLLTTSNTKLCLGKETKIKTRPPELEDLPGGGEQGPVLKHQLPNQEHRHRHFDVTWECTNSCPCSVHFQIPRKHKIIHVCLSLLHWHEMWFISELLKTRQRHLQQLSSVTHSISSLQST